MRAIKVSSGLKSIWGAGKTKFTSRRKEHSFFFLSPVLRIAHVGTWRRWMVLAWANSSGSSKKVLDNVNRIFQLQLKKNNFKWICQLQLGFERRFLLLNADLSQLGPSRASPPSNCNSGQAHSEHDSRSIRMKHAGTGLYLNVKNPEAPNKSCG